MTALARPALAAVVLAAGLAAAAEPATTPDAIARAVRDLGHRDYNVREQASAFLSRLNFKFSGLHLAKAVTSQRFATIGCLRASQTIGIIQTFGETLKSP